MTRLSASNRGHKNIGINLLVFLIFAGIVFFVNWSILLGDNLMKWDIWDAEYPSQVFISDVIKSGTFPVWNPLEMFGTPYYCIVGMPVLYPVTLLIDLMPTRVNLVAVSYCLHIVIAAFGAYLLSKSYLSRRYGGTDASVVIASFLAGVIYAGSGIFLSNAQHIMIIISAAWIPYVLYCILRYLDTRSIVFLMLGGIAASMIWLGGYPEMFFDLFLLLIPFVMVLSYSREGSVIKSILKAAVPFLLLVVFTMLAAAVTMIPFVNYLPELTRSDMGQNPNTQPFYALFSAILPGTRSVFTGSESSMNNFYASIFLLITLPMVPSTTFSKERKVSFALAVVCFLLFWGKSSALHSLLYRFVPFYSSFRFPTTLRALFLLFVLLGMLDVWLDVIRNRSFSHTALRVTKVAALILLAAWAVLSVWLLVQNDDSYHADVLSSLSSSCFLAGAIFGSYWLLFYLEQTKNLFQHSFPIVLTVLVICEVFVYAYSATSDTIAQGLPTQSVYSESDQKSIDAQETALESRNNTLEFKDSVRSTSGLDSQKILFQKTFDEEGYLSFKLRDTENYKATYNRSIIASNPVVYFTNDVVSADSVAFDVWANQPSVSSTQIFVDEPLLSTIDEDSLTEIHPSAVSAVDLDSVVADHTIHITSSIAVDTSVSRALRIYLAAEDAVGETPATLQFTDSSGKVRSFSSNFPVSTSENGELYIEFCLPSVNAAYSEVTVSLESAFPLRCVQYSYERLNSSENVVVDHFGLNSFSVTVHADTEGYLTILQSYNQYWQATVNGEPAEISKVNQAFMGIHLEPGTYEIQMKFRPTDLFVGFGISAAFYLVFVIAMVLYVVKRRRRPAVPHSNHA
ncbi:MAG: YfhO family protein [Oscillospiraceae bacterium]|nr:YfhO family protein [Oscillospiraceae bacterium]